MPKMPARLDALRNRLHRRSKTSLVPTKEKDLPKLPRSYPSLVLSHPRQVRQLLALDSLLEANAAYTSSSHLFECDLQIKLELEDQCISAREEIQVGRVSLDDLVDELDIEMATEGEETSLYATDTSEWWDERTHHRRLRMHTILIDIDHQRMQLDILTAKVNKASEELEARQWDLETTNDAAEESLAKMLPVILTLAQLRKSG
ncbi:hypothetical protein JAAARDRAFT_495763 [Jaapia argillacea MUCL 33604]|uniref:Uncharacterized protein n=1 Tax=Jaapia argillacea MUCL 33604 TaxID=933084 RepID=A0A067PAD9_9AGAM|nr:hypothetical protein JAAARDRAFT_495763 [Jaapia argillacea MUCL 33604]